MNDRIRPSPTPIAGPRARALAGWLDPLTARLRGREPKESADVLAFRSAPEIASHVPAEIEKALDGKSIFMAGIMTRKEKEHPFVLIEMNGNPHLVYFRERDGDPYGDAESFILSIAPGHASAADLLFIGGDFNNQPFDAWHRKGE